MHPVKMEPEKWKKSNIILRKAVRPSGYESRGMGMGLWAWVWIPQPPYQVSEPAPGDEQLAL